MSPSLAASWPSRLACKEKQVPLRQGALGVEQHALLKKPLDHLGKQIEMPGSFWQGRMSESVGERETVYKCTIIDFSLAHKFSKGIPQRPSRRCT